MRSLPSAGWAVLTLHLLVVSAPGATELPRSSEVVIMAEAETATETITLRVHGMLKSRSGAT